MGRVKSELAWDDIELRAAEEAGVEPDEIVWLRDLDGTGSMHPCSKGDPGAIPYQRID